MLFIFLCEQILIILWKHENYVYVSRHTKLPLFSLTSVAIFMPENPTFLSAMLYGWDAEWRMFQIIWMKSSVYYFDYFEYHT